MNKDSIIRGNGQSRKVTIDGIELSPVKSQAMYNHSPDGFSWGYCGSGPSQFALSLLLEATDQEEAALLYQSFKFDIISELGEDFEMGANQIYEWLELEREKRILS